MFWTEKVKIFSGFLAHERTRIVSGRIPRIARQGLLVFFRGSPRLTWTDWTIYIHTVD
jgi:hypothetical protein